MADDATPPHTLTGDVRTHDGFRSEHLANERAVVVYVPPGYDASDARYPVLYMHDGQNLFDEATAFRHEWRVDETAQRLITAGLVEPLLIVGIYNTGETRVDEYTPTASPDTGRGGKADRYGRMLVDELKPFVDRTYRTRPDAGDTAMGGSSLGGLLTLYLGLHYPHCRRRCGGTTASFSATSTRCRERRRSASGSTPARARAPTSFPTRAACAMRSSARAGRSPRI
jgi:predicted alpha/beta superfamily hydrolase